MGNGIISNIFSEPKVTFKIPHFCLISPHLDCFRCDTGGQSSMWRRWFVLTVLVLYAQFWGSCPAIRGQKRQSPSPAVHRVRLSQPFSYLLDLFCFFPYNQFVFIMVKRAVSIPFYTASLDGRGRQVPGDHLVKTGLTSRDHWSPNRGQSSQVQRCQI